METETNMTTEIRNQIPVIIPAYEPGETLLPFLAKLRDEGIRHLIVVDDGSGERYRAVFDAAEQIEGCRVLRHAVNLGKGRALKTAFNECLNIFPGLPGVVTADSDGQHTPQDILRCMQEMEKHPQALVLGCRDFDAPDVPARSSFGNKCTRAVFRYLLGLRVTDTQTGLRGIPGYFMEILMNVRGERFEYETNMLIETKDRQIPLQELTIETIYLEENRTSHFHPIRDSVRIYLVFAKFLFSSLSSSVVDLLLFSLFCSLLRGGGALWGVSYIVQATVMARVLSAAYNFTINYKVVFQSRENMAVTACKYCLLAICQMGCSAFLVDLLYGLTGGLEVAVKVPVDVLLFFLSFAIQREFVYRSRKKHCKKDNPMLQ